jgi:simple sugar transport system ATP-binding protein
MVGKDFSSLEKRDKTRKDKAHNDVLVETKNLGKRHMVDPFNLVIRKGETLGLAGLLGSGRTEAASLLFGIDEADSGELLYWQV